MDVDVLLGVNTYSLSDGVTCTLKSFSGLHAPPVRRLRSSGSQQHGESDHGFYLNARPFQMVFQIQQATKALVWDKRTLLHRYLGNFTDRIKLRFTLENGDVRQIDCDAMEVDDAWDAAEWYANWRGAFSFSAPDPTFYHPTAVAVVFSLGGGGESMDIPLPIPWPVGVATLDVTVPITYGGTWLSYPHLVRIVGPITDCVIENQATGEKLDFTGVTINAGDYYDIDLRYGYKTVVDSSGVNKIADLTSDSDLATFHLAHAVDGSASRVNSINVTGSVVTAATEVYLQYYTRYRGI